MDLFEEEEIFDETRAKLVENDTVASCGRDLNMEKIKESEDYYTGKPQSTPQIVRGVLNKVGFG